MRREMIDNVITRMPEPESWLPITDKVVKGIKPYYSVSTYGRIYSTAINGYMNPSPDEYGYMLISLMTDYGRSTIRLHRIILMTFAYIEGCEYLEVNHKDGFHYHNWLWNLEWATSKENINHAVENCLRDQGEDMYNAILTDKEAHMICRLIVEGKSDNEIAFIMNEYIKPRI